jgi:ABC-type polysaccharide/polyol phosphate transport system ATPase subunit
LAGIYPPTRGQARVEGRIGSLFEISVGFEPEATGWENVYFRGYLQGSSPRSIRRQAQGVADFSELGSFLDLPVRYYSAGMTLRLAFAIATEIDPEVLLIDEILSAGDMAFHAKASQRIKELMAQARLMVLVSHDLDAVRRLCNRALWLHQGQVRQMGSVKEVIDAYKTSGASANNPQAA